MLELNIPIRLWYFFLNKLLIFFPFVIYFGRLELQVLNPYGKVMNYIPDISKYASFSWFQCLWFYDEILKRKRVCRWLGPAHGVG